MVTIDRHIGLTATVDIQSDLGELNPRFEQFPEVIQMTEMTQDSAPGFAHAMAVEWKIQCLVKGNFLGLHLAESDEYRGLHSLHPGDFLELQ